MTMRQFATVPIDRLVNDVAVDLVHVRELADSIKASGPISPVMVRDETYELIDGFHRVAAMQELGFQEVGCILMPCDDETFWDLRIMSASLHKSVAFARAVDWVEECFRTSEWASRYKSAYSLFAGSRLNNLPAEANTWVAEKSQKWGLAPRTVEGWLYTKQSLAPEVLQAASHSRVRGNELSYTHLREIADELPNQPVLQKQVMEKVQTEGLSSTQTEAVARAVKHAPNPETAQIILRQPVSRTTEELTRHARVQQIATEIPHITRTERNHTFTGVALDVFLTLEHQISNVGRLTDETLAHLTPAQKDEMRRVLKTLIGKLQDRLDQLWESVELPDGVIVQTMLGGR